MNVDPRIRQYRQVASRNRALGEEVQSLITERDGLLAQLGQSQEDAADARRAQAYAESLALTCQDRIAALEAERDALRVELDTLRPRVSTGRRLHKGA